LYAYLDPSIPSDARVFDLLGRMTLAEKAFQLTSVLPNHIRIGARADRDRMRELLGEGIGQISGAVLGASLPEEIAQLNNDVQTFLREHTRLGIPAILHSEALNGVAGPAFTSFPTAIGLAATWNTGLIREMTEVIRDQLRAVGIRQALAPVLDIARDARWGRIHETFGEEVLLVSALGIAYVQGLQGPDRRRGILATAKHFLGYAMTEGGQNTAATRVGERELYDVYAAPFEAAIREAGLASVMNSYSEVDGVPVGLSRRLLTDLLRERMGLDGTVVSDYRTIQYAVDRLGAAPDAHNSAALALEAGLDVELPAPYGYGRTLVEAVERGLVDTDVVDRAVRRVLAQKFDLGLFEDPFVDAEPAVVRAVADMGRGIARQQAEQSVVLLKNDDAVLPIGDQVRRVAVIGPHATKVVPAFGNYTYPPLLEMIRGLADGRARMAGMEAARDELPPTLREAFDRQIAEMKDADPEQMVREMYGSLGLNEALAAEAPHLEISAVDGCDVLEPIEGGIESAVAAARESDIVILALGGRSGAFAGNSTEGEGTDSATMQFPAAQLDLVDAVVATGTPVVAVVTVGRPYDLRPLTAGVSAILLSAYPGPAGTPAVARLLTGAIAPSGKLPYTVPRTVGQVPIYSAQKRGSGYRRLEKDIFKGYLDESSAPLFPLGHGLSYTSYEYSDLKVDEQVRTDGTLHASVTVTNTGARSGTEVVQVYLDLPAMGTTRPAQVLGAFARVTLAPESSSTVSVQIPLTMCGYTAADDRFVVDPGYARLLVGSSSDDIRVSSDVNIVGERVEIAQRTFVPTILVDGVPQS
jgi:beta-xylosidase